ncbi:MAG: hypothetical protein COA43_04870 [Robiginitomaculum sp.]|nr:MAG: hypothetical protein COA43_04870 [Robiginitomaculum sp.]
MSDENSKAKDTPKPTKAFDAFAIRNDKNGKGHFYKIGAAFAHKDGQGYSVDMVAAPSNGRLTLRTPKERLEANRGGSQNGANRGKGGDRSRE